MYVERMMAKDEDCVETELDNQIELLRPCNYPEVFISLSM